MTDPDEGAVRAAIAPPAKPKDYIVSTLFIVLAGIVLPAMTLGIEAFTHVSGESFFDPIPSIFHGLLIALVPLANAWALLELHREPRRDAKAFAWLNAFAIGVAAFYAVLYLPLTPFAPFAVLFNGFGLLPLAPLLSLLAACWGRRLVNRRLVEQGAARLPGLWRGLALALLLFIVIDLPFTLTRIGLHMATAADAESRQSGMRWLRAVGDEKLLRQLCYARSGMSTDLIGMLFSLGDPVTPEEARKVYYRVTGTPFNDLPAPARKSLRDWRRDADAGGSAVGGRLSGVGLAASRIDGSVDADASLAYLEWTLVFRNQTAAAQEGRAQIALPPGAVVSRLTLWIDGEEREAAFGTRAQTRQAYQKVVSRQRDPVLVTSAGKDRLMLQLFPIPPAGGEMKVRVGMSVPLPLADAGLARLQLPAFRERNFEIAPGFAHAVWLAADSPLAAGKLLRQEEPAPASYDLRGDIEDEKLGAAGSAIDVPRNPLIRTVWSEDARAGKGRVVVQRFAEQAVSVPRRVALVVDSSRPLAPLASEIATALAHFPAAVELGLFPATDLARPPAGAMTREQAARVIRDMAFVGGQDNLVALSKAWDWAGEGASGAILWIHGPQPVLLSSIEPLLQRNQRRPGWVRFHSIEARPGPNEVLEALDRLPMVSPVARQASLQADLERVFASWAPGAMETRVAREQLPPGASLPEGALKTSDHLARLWAADQVQRLLENGDQKADDKARQAATDLALRYHLVTPLSGAVVLETARQYEDAGLSPVDKGSVPTVPEPEEWLLIAAVLVLLLWMARRRSIARPLLAA